MKSVKIILGSLLIASVLLTLYSNRDYTQTNQNGIKEYLIYNKATGLDYTDFDKVNSMCSSFLKEYYHAATSFKAINLDTYFNNNNLKKYILIKLEKGTYRSENKILSFDFNVDEIIWNMDRQTVFISIVSKVTKEIGAFSEVQMFMVTNIEGRIWITDWYSKSMGNPSYFDEITRGGHLERLDNESIWEDEVWVEDLFSRIN